ncbi:MAG TPA: hypothetical protein VNS22_25735 [Geminicoccus sp.]|uniref:hypothetical protein n=1 Tax=Geminicoccus sp. TaxID=2024832 RepID=UPI002B96035E|nr:hypothetical protein [Geminicoccus sp.]HWL71759.1 hypothetical protein [Geminicoccus sp.]
MAAVFRQNPLDLIAQSPCRGIVGIEDACECFEMTMILIAHRDLHPIGATDATASW